MEVIVFFAQSFSACEQRRDCGMIAVVGPTQTSINLP
jgi:hypothetical protein